MAILARSLRRNLTQFADGDDLQFVAGTEGDVFYRGVAGWSLSTIAQFVLDAPRKVHDVTASGAAVAWSLSEGSILELQNVNANVTVTVTDDRVGGTNNRLELNEVLLAVTQDAVGGRTVTMAGDFPAGAVTLVPTQAGQTGSGASETGIASWVRARSTGTPASDWVFTGSENSSGSEIQPASQIGGSTFAWDLAGDGLARYASLTLNQDMSVNLANIALGQYGNAQVTQTTGGHRILGGTGLEVVGKVDQAAAAVTQFELLVNAGTTAQLKSMLTPKEGENALGNASGVAAVNFEEGASDNKTITLDANWAPTLSAQRPGEFQMRFVQGGGFQWTPPANVTYTGTVPQVNTTAGSETLGKFYFDGTNFRVIAWG